MDWAEITSRGVDTEWPESDAGASSAVDTTPPVEGPPRSGLDLEDVDAFADLPEEMHAELARAARVEDLAGDEEVAGFGAALVLDGEAHVCATIVDIPAHRAATKTLVPSRGTLAEGIPLRVVAGANGARVALWDQATIDDALRSCPWVVEELQSAADRLQALAGATMGPLGDLDEAALPVVLDQLQLTCLEPGEIVVAEGNPMPGLVVIGAGVIELLEAGSEEPTDVLGSGDLLFTSALLTGQPAPATARAGAGGALMLLGEHPVLRRLFESAPELVSLLAEDG